MPDQLLKKESPMEKFQLTLGGSLFYYLSMVLFILVAAAYGGLLLLNKNLKDEEPKLLEAIQLKQIELRRDLKEILALESRLRNLKKIISAHRLNSRIFQFLEKNTHPRVQFSSFTLAGAERQMRLVGETLNYATLAQQITLFELDPEVEHVEFGGLSRGLKNRINFNLEIKLTPPLFIALPQS